MDNFNPDDISDFKVPDQLLQKIFEISGDTDHNKGFIFIVINTFLYDLWKNSECGYSRFY